MPYHDAVQHAVAKVAQFSRRDRPKPEELEAARAELVAARLQRAIEEAKHPEPPYSPIRRDDAERLAEELLDFS